MRMTCVASIKFVPDAAFLNDNMITLMSSSFLKLEMALFRLNTFLHNVSTCAD
jgi:hypothetical protein